MELISAVDAPISTSGAPLLRGVTLVVEEEV